jgi:hypothetical protein
MNVESVIQDLITLEGTVTHFLAQNLPNLIATKYALLIVKPLDSIEWALVVLLMVQYPFTKIPLLVFGNNVPILVVLALKQGIIIALSVLLAYYIKDLAFHIVLLEQLKARIHVLVNVLKVKLLIPILQGKEFLLVSARRLARI